MKTTLAELAARIERLGRAPHEVRARWASVLRPVLRLARWRPELETGKLAELVNRIDVGLPQVVMIAAVTADALLEDAIWELAENVTRVEWALVVRGRAPDGQVDWLWRMYQTLFRASEWVRRPERRAVLKILLADEADRALGCLAGMRTTGAAAAAARGIDPTIDAALAETRSLDRQRRLLEGARRLLLRARAAGALDPAAANARALLITRRIARLDRLEAAGISADVDLVFQLREAAQRGEADRLHTVLVALEEGALMSGDGELSELTGAALDGLWQRRPRHAPEEGRWSLRESQRQVFGDEVRSAIERAYAGAPDRLKDIMAKRRAKRPDEFNLEKEIFNSWSDYFTQQPTDATLAAAVAVGGCFDLGVAAAPARHGVVAGRARLVRHPTQQLVLAEAESVDDLPQAVIGDPRLVLPDLAAGKLMARRFLDDHGGRTGGATLRREVRVYVLDGSSSMVGPRARMRDAILVAELTTMSNRLLDPGRATETILYYQYFNEKVGSTCRIGSPAEALLAIDDVIGSIRFGGTDIQKALLASFERIRDARRDDPALAHAQIVLVTDGDAPIIEDELRAARERTADLPIGVSIIALGVENPALRRLAADQRARGEPVFYQFMDDAELRAIAGGDTAGLPIHLPPELKKDGLRAEVAALATDIERHLRSVDAAALERARAMPDALTDVALDPRVDLGAGERARRAALENDALSVEVAFRRAFPMPPEEPEAATPPVPDEDADAVLAALATVADVVSGFGGAVLERQADAIAILHRLLAEASVPPWRYAELVKTPWPAIANALRAVQAAARAPAP